MPMNEEVRKAVEAANDAAKLATNDSEGVAQWNLIRAELTRLYAIADSVDPLVIRLGEVTTRLEAENALLRKIRGCINETRGAYAGDVVREIDAHLSENGHDHS